MATQLISKRFSYSDFLRQTYRMAQNVSFDTSTAQSLVYSDTVTQDGYYPIGIVGFRSSKANIVASSAKIQNEAEGSCTLQFRWDYLGSATDTANLYADILWVKI